MLDKIHDDLLVCLKQIEDQLGYKERTALAGMIACVYASKSEEQAQMFAVKAYSTILVHTYSLGFKDGLASKREFTTLVNKTI